MKTQKQIKDSCNLCFASYVGMIILIFALLCSGCYVTSYAPDPIYDDHTTEVYYHNAEVYWGYHSGFYYYYGTPHFHPWWYYYMYQPAIHYHVHTHVHIHCDNGLFVYSHRGNKLNNKKERHYKNIDTKHTMMREVMPDNKITNKKYYNYLNKELIKHNVIKQNYNKPNNIKINNKTNNIKINNKPNRNNNKPNRSNKNGSKRK